MESQISHNIAALFTSRPKAYSTKMINKLTKLRLLYKNNYNTNFNDKLKPHQKIISVNGITVLLLVIISALILLHDVCDFEISKYIFICIATFICVINDKYDIYCFIAFLVPVSSGIPATYITAIALVLVLFKSIYSFKYLFLGIGCIFLVLFLELFSGIDINSILFIICDLQVYLFSLF